MFAGNTITKQRNDHNDLLKYANLKRHQGVFHDVTIKTDGKCFPANRLVLSCYSKFFETMFQTDMKEKYQSTVDMNTVDEKSMQNIIDFIYTGKIVIDEKNVIALLSAADYLLMDDVKQYCFEFLESNITSDNCFTVFDVSILYENKSLQNKVYKQISNNFDTVVAKEEFKHLSKDKLVSCVSNLNQNQVEETSIYNAIISWTNHDLENRESEFAKLFQLIKLDRLSLDFLINVALDEKIVQQNQINVKFLKSNLSKRNKDMQLRESGSKILSFGGSKTLSKVIKVYEYQAENTIEYPVLPITNQCHCALFLKDIVYVLGGMGVHNDSFTDQMWQMNLKKARLNWQKLSSMFEPRCAMGATVYNDALIVAGGYTYNDSILASSEIYLKQIDEWKIISPLNHARFSNELVSCDDRVFCLGGYDGENVLSSVEHLVNLKSQWEFVESMLTPRKWFAAVNYKEMIYAIGGLSDIGKNTTLKSVEKYNPDENEWTYVCDMNIERRSHSACVLQNKVYVVGGLDSERRIIKQIECYDFALNKWSIIDETPEELYNHKLVTI